MEFGLPEGASCTPLDEKVPEDHYRYCDMSLPGHVEPASPEGLLYCDPQARVCKRLHVAKEGEACGDALLTLCVDGFLCDKTQSKCVTCPAGSESSSCRMLRKIGEPCTDSGDCRSGRCNLVTKTCGTKLTGTADQHSCTGN